MKNKKKNILISLAMCVVSCLILLAPKANADSLLKNIQAVLNKKVSIVYYGRKQELKDANNQKVYPITYNGTTYLPIRSIGNMMNLPVDYNSKTSTIVLGSEDVKRPANLIDLPIVKNDYSNKYNSLIFDKASLTVNSNEEGTKVFKNGITYNIWNSDWSCTDPDDVMYFDVTGYNKIKFTAYATKYPTEIIMYGQYADGNYIQAAKFPLNAFELVDQEVDISRFSRIGFGARSLGNVNKDDGYGQVFDPVVE